MIAARMTASRGHPAGGDALARAPAPPGRPEIPRATASHRALRRRTQLVPVSYPYPDPADTSGNRLSGYLLDLPVHEPDPLQRLRAVRHAMTMNKAAGPGRGPGALPVLAGLLPPLVHRPATPMVASTAPRLFNTVITQVPVPDLPLTLAGARLTALYPVVPLAAGQALGVAMATYDGSMHVGLHADPELLDLDTLAQHFGTALGALLAC
jgi:diacylglycerol O-acyltransferase